MTAATGAVRRWRPGSLIRRRDGECEQVSGSDALFRVHLATTSGISTGGIDLPPVIAPI